jgi:hypothetical protein
MATKRRFEPLSATTRKANAGLISIFALMLLAGCGAGAGSGNGGNNISVSITNKKTSIQAGTAALVFTATVQNDSSNSGVTWTLTTAGLPCSPLCGALSQATSTTVAYTPPGSAPAGLSNQPSLTATSVAKTNKSDSDAFTITAALTVTITNKFGSVNTGASPFVLNATVQNDSTNSGVTWTLTTNGAACSASACGSLTGITTSSVTYSPPPSVSGSQPTLTATSVHNSSKSDSDSFTIQKAPIRVTIANKITSINANGAAFGFSANLQNDATNPTVGVTWSLTVSGANCQPACGTLATQNQGFSTITYTPPPTAPASPNNRPTLTAVSTTDPTKSDTDTFNINPPASISVTITQVSSVLAGETGGINFDANVQNDSSNSGVTWTLMCAPSTNCGSFSSTSSTSATYMPPLSAPASPNNQARITATSIADNMKSGSDTVTITSSIANSCGAATGHESLLKGHYALLLQGFAGSGTGTPLLAGASFMADGSGAINSGEEDINDTISTQHLTFDSTPGRSFYTVGADQRGCLQFTNTGGTTSTFRFALGGVASGIASKGRVIEFDDGSGSGKGSRASGILRLQDPNSFTLSALQAQYAFGLDGWGMNGAQVIHAAMAGFFSNSNGSLSNGVIDINDAGNLGGPPAFMGLTGTINPISATTGRAAGGFLTQSGQPPVFDWSIYVINASELIIIGTDPLSNVPMMGGRAIATGKSFTAASLSGNYIAHSSGNISSNSEVDLQLLTVTPGGGQTGTISGTVYSDAGGNGLQTTTLSSVTYNVDSASGRVALGNPGDNLPILYLTTSTDGISAFLIGLGGDAQMGLVEFQPSQTYSTTSVGGTFFFGTEDPEANGIYNEAGAVTISNSGSANVTVDSSSTSGLTPSVPFSTTLTINSSGVGSLSSISSLVITNGAKIFYIDETVGVIVEAEQ